MADPLSSFTADSNSAVLHEPLEQQEFQTVEFVDVTDLQTRLVLFPRVPDEGIGAMVAEYHPARSTSTSPVADSEKSTRVAAPDSNMEQQEAPSLCGCVLLGFVGDESNWRERDFSDILARIKQQKASEPIVLRFSLFSHEGGTASLGHGETSCLQQEQVDQMPDKRIAPIEEAGHCIDEKKTEECDVPRSTATKPPPDSHTPQTSREAKVVTRTSSDSTHYDSTISSPSFSLSKWTSRVSAAAAAVQTTAKKAHAAATTPNPSSSHSRMGSAQETECNRMLESCPFHLFVQSETRAFLPVSVSASCNINAIVTNVSSVEVRRSAAVALDDQENLVFEWYRSCDVYGWTLLEGASRASLTPSVTEIGYRLKCRVSACSSADSDILSLSNATYDCVTAGLVKASLPLFHAARKALVGGAPFSGLHGRGNAKNRIFRLVISMASSELSSKTSRRSSVSSKNQVMAKVSLFQVSQGTAEPLADVFAVTACSDYSHAKHLEILLPVNDAKDNMVVALCTSAEKDEAEDPGRQWHRFQLKAPNRLARESLLLAIGISNFKGKPSDLNEETILYPSPPEECENIQGDRLRETALSTEQPQFQFNPSERNASTDSRSVGISTGSISSETSPLENELQLLREKLARKDKVISELHRHVKGQDDLLRTTEQALQTKEVELHQNETITRTVRQALEAAESKMYVNNTALQSMQDQFNARTAQLEQEIYIQKEKISTLVKANRTLQNDKDILDAAVEARDSKLSKMSALQVSFDEVSVQMDKKMELQKDLDKAVQQSIDAKAETKRMLDRQRQTGLELKHAHAEILALNSQLQMHSTESEARQSKLETDQLKIQKLRAERNSYSKKCDSLAKEMSRVCRHGRTLREVEKVLADDLTRREEVELLRDQKRSALAQAEHYRTAYEQSLGVQKLAGLDHDAGKLLERNAELDRLLSELTEYLGAKEMQLETMKQVNDTLQSEIRDLAKANMSKNDI